MAEKPVTIDERKLFTLPGVLLISIVALAGGVGVGFANFKAEIDEVPSIKNRLDEHDKALAKIEVMANDIGWIKKELERQRREEQRNSKGSSGAAGGP